VTRSNADLIYEAASSLYTRFGSEKFWPEQLARATSLTTNEAAVALRQLVKEHFFEARVEIRLDGVDIWKGPLEDAPSGMALGALYQEERGEPVTADGADLEVTQFFQAKAAFKRANRQKS
jgi:hypothetical protein